MIQVREQYGNIYVKIIAVGPMFDSVMDRILTIPGRVYNSTLYECMFGKEVLEELLLLFENQIVWAQPLEEIVGEDEIDTPLVKKHMEWAKSDVFSSFKIKPYPYQKTGAHFLASRGQAATLDGVGLGKTIQIIGASHILKTEGKIRKSMIVTLNGIKSQWAHEVHKFTNYKAIAAVGTKAQRIRKLKEFQSSPDIDFIIVNYEMLRTEEFVQILLNSDIDFIALDEAQMIKSGIDDYKVDLKPSGIARGAHRFKHIPYRFIATATPVQNKAEEVFSLFYFLNEDILGSWESYKNDYCEVRGRFGIVDYKNLNLLYMKIAPYFIRRTKEMPEIQQQLPSTIHSQVRLQMTDAQFKIQNALNEKLEEYKEARSSISGSKVINGNMMTEDEQREYYDGMSQGIYNFLLTNLNYPALLAVDEASKISKGIIRDLNISDKDLQKSPKYEHMVDYIDQILNDEPNSKIVIFTQFARMANLMFKKFSEGKFAGLSVLYTGETSEANREFAVSSFRDYPGCRIFIATSAADTGINLNFANYMIHYDMPFNPTDIEQRNGRIDRTGNPFKNLTFTYYVTENSYEEDQLKLLERKRKTAKQILYGE
mgnify:CR=1 FL=1